MAPKGIFCLEGLWDNDLKRKSSVQPMLNMLEVNSGVPYIHQDVATVEELEFYLSRWKQARYRNFPILYLAFHGENEALIIGKYEYTLDRLSNFLNESCKNSIIMLASCSTLRTDIRNIKRFLRKTNALAICGYKSKVNWMQAAAFELLVLASFQDTDFSGRGVRTIERQAKLYGNQFSDLNFTIVTKPSIYQRTPLMVHKNSHNTFTEFHLHSKLELPVRNFREKKRSASKKSRSLKSSKK